MTTTTAASYTVKDVTAMNATQLREVGTAFGLTSISRTPKAVLLQMVLDKVDDGLPFPTEASEPIDEVEEIPKATKKTLEVYVSEEHRAILDNAKLSKSEKMRRLWKKDMSIADIHRSLDTHYSFTYGVIDRYRKIVDPK